MARLKRESEGHHRAVLPQHQQADGTFEVTGENSPLPVKQTGSYVGYSADTKPTSAKKGDSFLELDTKDVYIYDGGKWVVL